VAAARLTRGQARDQHLFPQVTAKCEGLTRSEHMWIFKKIDCGLKMVPLVQPEVLESGRASNAWGVLRAPEWPRVH